MDTIAIAPFVDSTADLGRPAELRQRLRRDGYLFLRGVIPQRALARACEETLAIVAAAGWLLDGTAPNERLAHSGRTCVEPQPEFRRVYNQVYSQESFHALPHEKALTDILALLLEVREPLVHPRKIARLIFPCVPDRRDFSTPAHQDYWALEGSPDTITAWMPLHDCPLEHGSLMVARGTHRDGIYPYRLALGAGAVEVEAPLEGRWHGGNVAAGDVVLFYTLTVHRAAPNRTPRMRLSLDCRFQRPHDPISEPCVDLKGGPPWEEIYSGWSGTDLQYYWRKWRLRTIPYTGRHYERRDKLAFEEGEKGNPLAISALQRLAEYHGQPEVRRRAQALLDQLGAVRQ